MRMKQTLLALALGLVVGVASAGADPLVLDCTAGCSITDAEQPFGLAYWATTPIQPAGSGVFGTFLRLQAPGNGGIETGHNTDGNPVNDEKNGTHTHSVEMAALNNLVAINGHAYYEFAMDINESAGPPESLISLDELKICSADSATLTRTDDCPADPETYNLDLLADRTVLFDYDFIGTGSGASDLLVYIPYALVHTDKKYFYLYSGFGARNVGGVNWEAEAGFEEWAYQSRAALSVCPDGSIPNPGCPFGDPPDDPPGDPVPEPASLMLLGGGLVAGLAKKYRNNKNA